MNNVIEPAAYLPGGPLQRGATSLGIDLTPSQLQQFQRYAELLSEWNLRFNLTRIPADQYVPLHFLDSLAISSLISFRSVAEGGKLIDVGTGAGLPGLPLKIAFPHLNVVLMDSTAKRLKFLDEVISTLGLVGIHTVHMRAEDACKNVDHRAKYDVATARAVAKLTKLSAWLLPLVSMGGSMIAMKSVGIDEEVADSIPELRKLGGAKPQLIKITVPDTDIERLLVSIMKIGG